MAYTTTIEEFSLFMADDDVDDLEMMELAFKEIGYEFPVKCFNNGESMFDYLISRKSKTPALLLLDLNMPKSGGKNILDKIRHHSDLETITVIVYSTSSAREDILDAYALGCNAYVIKPNCYSEIKKIASGIKKLWFDTHNVSKFHFELARA
jgi:CheY-like chemotaxis protein